jgi:glycosyltransferase involved in cell wall biosynthesis
VPGKASREYLQSLGSEQKIISIAPNAVDNAWFRNRGEEVRRRAADFRASLGLPPRFILFSGRLVPQKGVFDLLDAYAKLESDIRSQVGLVFAGDGFCRTELEQQAKRISPGVICFTGFAHRENLAGLYALAEALVLPTHSDPWGLVVNEAMACGLPIIVSNVAGCSADLVKDGWNGYIVPPRDADKLSLAINSLVRQPELRERMSARSTEWIQNYSPEACANGLAVAAIGPGKGMQ